MNKIMLWTVNLCRICAKESDYLISIFDKSTNLDLENKIRHCLSCNISKEDVKPKQICQICCMKLNDLYQFITLFHKSNDGFETLLLNSIETTNQLVSKQEYGIVNESFRSTNNDNTGSMKGSSMPLAIEYRNNIIDIDGLDVAASNFTEKGVVSEISINNNVKSEIQNIIQEHSNEHYLNVTCEEKQAQAYTKEKLKNMNSKEKFNKTVSSLIKSSSYSEEYYNHNVMNSKLEKSCDDLSQPKDPLHFSNAQKISPFNHFQGTILIEDPTLDGQCLIPNKTYNYAENNDIQRINYNAIDHHSDNSQSIIKTKNHQINNSEELTTNNTPEYNKSNELNSCTSVQNTNHNRYKMISVKAICKAFEKQQNSNVDHLKPKVSKTRKTCDSLNKIKTFACNMCEKSFSRQQCLNIHIKKHDNLHLYMCNVCDKTFALQWYLTSHKRIHTDLFSCEHCGKCFNAPSKLQRHTRTHTGERPFKCPVENCGKSFSDKCNLAGHQITHTNVRNFGCDICKRSYKTKSQLREHLQAHSESPIFKCKICDKSYKWKANLILHRKKHKE